VSGILLQVKKQSSWVQPPTQKGTSTALPTLSWKSILDIAKQNPECNVSDWESIVRLDVQPSKGIVKVQTSTHWELQIDLQTGELLSKTIRRSDWIETLHDGTFFGEWAKLAVFLPNGIVLLILWITGAYLWYLPFYSRSRKRARLQNPDAGPDKTGTGLGNP
jgi:uncharacterized iron-regulated membrane protein